MNPIAADIILDAGPAIWRRKDEFDGSIYLLREFTSKPRGTFIVEQGSIGIFDESIRVVDEPHLPTSFRTMAEPSSPGIPATAPERMSSRRFLARASQAA